MYPYRELQLVLFVTVHAVSGCQIAMDDSLGANVLHAFCNLKYELHTVQEGEWVSLGSSKGH